jgi:hypothetical protein
VSAPGACAKAGTTTEAARKITDTTLIRRVIVLLPNRRLTVFQSRSFHTGYVAQPEVTPVTVQKNHFRAPDKS